MYVKNNFDNCVVLAMIYYCVKIKHNGKSIYVHTSPCFSSHFLSKIKLEEYNNKKVMVLYDSDLDKVYVIKKV